MNDLSVSTASPIMSKEIFERLRQTRAFVFDMDGTMVLGDQKNKGLQPIPGAIELTELLASREIPFLFFTNGTTRTPEHYADTVRKLGFHLPEGALMTPVSSAVDLFVRKGYQRVMVLGGDGLKKPLEAAGIEIVPDHGRQQADAVLVGWYRECTMENLEAACHAVWAGAQFYTSSQAVFFATAQGRALGTSRAIAAMVKDLTGCRVHLVGKPSIHALSSAASRLGVRLKDMAVVGDDPDLEMSMAHRGKSLAVAVTTGLTDAQTFAQLPEKRRPHLILSGVEQLHGLLKS
ncbi:MAG: HAD hydrolase-like protein [Motiliproteus sp.]